MNYRAFKVKLNNGLETFKLLPLSKDCVFVDGVFFLENNSLLLVSSVVSEKFDLIEKFNPDGTFKISSKTNKPEVERLRTENPYNYQLVGEDLEWFIKTYVSNSEDALAIVAANKLKIETPSLITTELN